MLCMRSRRSVRATFAAIIVASVATLYGAMPAQARDSFNWAHTFTTGQLQRVTSVAHSQSGEVFVGGYFRGQIDFDPSVGESILNSGPDEAGFIAKYGVTGNLIWACAISGSDHVRVNDLAVDVVNQIAVVGSFRGEVDLDPGPAVFDAASQGSTDIFVLAALYRRDTPMGLCHGGQRVGRGGQRGR